MLTIHSEHCIATEGVYFREINAFNALYYFWFFFFFSTNKIPFETEYITNVLVQNKFICSKLIELN